VVIGDKMLKPKQTSCRCEDQKVTHMNE